MKVKGKIIVEFDYTLQGTKAEVDKMLKVIQDMVLAPSKMLDEVHQVVEGLEKSIYETASYTLSNPLEFLGTIEATTCKVTHPGETNGP